MTAQVYEPSLSVSSWLTRGAKGPVGAVGAVSVVGVVGAVGARGSSLKNTIVRSTILLISS